MNYLKKSLAALMVVIMMVTSVPLQGFVGFEMPEWFSFDAKAVEKDTVITENASTEDSKTKESEKLIDIYDKFINPETLKSDAKDFFESLKKSSVEPAPSFEDVPIMFSIARNFEEEELTDEQPTSGTINETVLWEYDVETKTLTVGGEGEIPFYFPSAILKTWPEEDQAEVSYSLAPWDAYLVEMEKLVIGGGITGIGEYNFAVCVNLKDIVFSDGLTSMDMGCFLFATEIESLKFPSTLVSMGEGCFCYSANLRELYLNEGLETIGESSFEYAYYLNELYIPSTYVGDGWGINALGECNFVINSDAPFELHYSSTGDNEVFYKDVIRFETKAYLKLELGIYNDPMFVAPEDMSDEELMIILLKEYNKDFGTDFGSFEELGDYLDVNYLYIEEKFFPSENCIISFADNEIVHNGCHDKYVTHYEGASEVPCECFAFSGEYYDGMYWSVDKETRTLTLSGTTAEKPQDAGEVYNEYIYANRYIDTVVYAPDSSITTIDEYAFYQMDIKSIIIPSNISIIRYHAFRGCNKLSNVIFEEHPDGVNAYCTIWGEAFRRCDSLKEIDLPEHIHWLSDNAFNMSGIEKITIRRKDCQISDTDVPETIPEKAVIYGYSDSTAEAFAVANNRKYKCIDKASVDDFEIEIIEIEGFEGNVGVIKKYFGKAYNVEIPEEVDGFPIVKIDWNAFENNKYAERVVLSDNIAIVEMSAFSKSAVNTLVLGNSIRKMSNFKPGEMTGFEIHTDNINKWFDIEFSYNSNPLADGARLIVNGEPLSELVVPDTVKEINSSAFYGYKELTCVVIPSGVTSIGEYAFSGTSITEVSIPETVERMKHAFADTPSLKTVIFEDGVTVIPDDALQFCSSVTDVVLPETLITIGSGAFAGTSITEITIPAKVENMEGAFSEAKLLEKVVFAEGIETVSERAFYDCEKLSTVEFSSSVRTIDEEAFYSCDNLKEISLPKGLEKIGIAAFTGTAITDIFIPKTVISMDRAFNYTGLSDVVFEEGIKAIPTKALYGCADIVEIELPESVVTIGAGAFYGTSIKEFTVAATIIEATGAFEGAKKLEKVIVQSGILKLSDRMFYGCESLNDIKLPDTVTSVGEYCFYGCKALEDVALPSMMTSIGSNAFDATGIKEIKIPKTVSVMSNAFSGADMLEKVVFEKGMSVIPKQALKYAEKATLTVVIPDTITEIGQEAFYNCYGLTSIELPQGLVKIGSSAFYGTMFTEISIPQSVTTMTNAFSNSAVTKVIFEKGRTEIPSDAFKGNSKIEEILLPDSVTKIGSYAFYNCKALSNISLPEILTDIGAYAFYGCEKITEINIPLGVTKINNYTFYNCKGLAKIALPADITAIGNYALYGCKGITEMDIPDSVNTVGTNAFAECSALEIVSIGKNVAEISQNAFNGCMALEEVYAYNLEAWLNISFGTNSNPMTYAKELYFNNKKVREIVIPETVTEIKAYTFYNCANIEKVEIPDTVISIDNYAFAKCSSLSQMYIPDSVKKIGNGCFSDCTGVEEIVLNDGVTSIGSSAFAGCTKIYDISIPVGVETLTEKMFSGCVMLSYITVYGNVKTINSKAFEGMPENCRIYGRKGTKLETFAQEHNIRFISLKDDSAPEIISFNTQGKSVSADEFTLNVEAKDNVSIQKVTFYYKSITSDEDYITIGTKEFGDNTSKCVCKQSFDVSGLDSGEYKIVARVTDAYGNKTSSVIYREVDNQAPETPEAFKASGSPDYIYLIWRDYEDVGDLDHFNIYRSESLNGTFTKVKQTSSLGYYDDLSTGITADKIYYYYITAVDKIGNESEPTEIKSAAVSEDVYAPEIYQWKRDSSKEIYNIGKEAFRISIYDNFKLKSVSLQYREDGDTEWLTGDTAELKQKSEIAALEWNTGALEAGVYELRFEVTDDSGNVAAGDAEVYTVHGRTPVEVPVLTADSSHRSVELSWTYGGDEGAVDYYTIYRKAADALMFTKVKTVSANKFRDTVSPGEYIYKITVTDRYSQTAESEEVQGFSVINDKVKPVAVSNVVSMQVYEYMPVMFDAGASKDNEGIVSYLWDFGDGTTSDEIMTEHTYQTEGVYSVTLTVTDIGGNTDIATAEVRVFNRATAYDKKSVKVVVTNSDNEPVDKATVSVTNSTTSDTTTVMTDGEGIVKILLDTGYSYALSSYKEGSEYDISHQYINLTEEEGEKIEPVSTYMIYSRNRIENENDYVVTVRLRASNFTGEISVEELDASEIEAVGLIGEKMEIMKFEAEFKYIPDNLPEERELIYTAYYKNKKYIKSKSIGAGSRWGKCAFYFPSGNGRIFPPSYTEGKKIDPYILRVSGGASCVKQIFRVDLILFNSSTEDMLEDCMATINTGGLRVANGEESQSVPSPPPGGQSMLTWYLVGDSVGRYTVSVDIEGYISPEPLEPYKAKFVASEAIEVIDLSEALDVDIDVPYLLFEGKSSGTAKFTNISNKTLNFIEVEAFGKSASKKELKPYETLDVTFEFEAPEVPDDYDFWKLISSKITIMGIPLPESGANVNLNPPDDPDDPPDDGGGDSYPPGEEENPEGGIPNVIVGLELREEEDRRTRIDELMRAAGTFYLKGAKEIEKPLLLVLKVSNEGNKESGVVDLEITIPHGFSREPFEIVTEPFTYHSDSIGPGAEFEVYYKVYPIYNDSRKKFIEFEGHSTPESEEGVGGFLNVPITTIFDEGKVPFPATSGASNLSWGTGGENGIKRIDWNLSDFNGSTTRYNNGTAKFLMAMSSSVYKKDCIEEAFGNLGFGNIRTCNYPAGNGQIVPESKADECSFAFATKKIVMSNASNPDVCTLILIIVRGTVHNEWYGNFNVGYGPEHYSFKYASEIVKKEFQSYYYDLTKNGRISPTNVRVAVSGHSRGAAIANLLAAQVLNIGKIGAIHTEDVYAYTFATPNVSQNAASGSLYANIFNIINPIDFVGYVPPGFLGFGRYGTDLYLYSSSIDFINNCKAINAYYSEEEFTGGRLYFDEVNGTVLIEIVTQALFLLGDWLSEIVTSCEEYNDKPIGEYVTEWLASVILDALTKNIFARAVVAIAGLDARTIVEKLKTSDIYDVLADAIAEFLDSNGIRISALNNIELSEFASLSVAGALKEVVKILPFVNPSSITEGVTNDPVMYLHACETYMSWLEVKNPTTEYGFVPYVKLSLDIIPSFRDGVKALVKCPVDVEVIDENGNVVARITDSKIDETIEDGIDCSALGIEKEFYLPEGSDYSLRITAYDDGNMSCKFDQISADGDVERMITFEDITIQKGQTIIANIGQDGELTYSLVMPDGKLKRVTKDIVVTKIEADIDSDEAVEKGTEVNLFCNVEGASLYYTTDGSSPADADNPQRALYTGAITITEPVVILACAVSEGDSSEKIELSTKRFSYTLSCSHSDLTVSEAETGDCESVRSVKYYYCNDCDLCFEDAECTKEITLSEILILPEGHKLQKQEHMDASCENDGFIEHYKCVKCSKLYLDEQALTQLDTDEIVIPAAGHKETVLEAVAATCTDTGLKEGKKCSVCDDILVVQDIIPVMAHTLTTLKAVAPTCTKEGLTEGKKCTACGVTTVAQKTVAKKAHSLTTLKAVAATYKATGLTEGKKCTACGKVTVAQKTVAKKVLGKVTGLKTKAVKLASSTKTTLTLAWTKVADAQKYEVYQQSGKKWKKIGTTSKTTLTVKKLKANKSYKFKVRAIRSDAKGAYSSNLTAKTVPLTPTVTLKAGKKALTASWKTVANITGYEVQASTSRKFTTKTTKKVTIKKAKTKKTTIKKLTKGKKYYVKVRAYKTVGKTKIYSAWSRVKTVNVK